MTFGERRSVAFSRGWEFSTSACTGISTHPSQVCAAGSGLSSRTTEPRAPRPAARRAGRGAISYCDFDGCCGIEVPDFGLVASSDGSWAFWIRRFDRTGLRAPRNLSVDKLTTVPERKPGRCVGRLDDEDIVRLNRVIVVVLGLAGSPSV